MIFKTGRETIGDDVMQIFLKDRQLNGDFISKVSDRLWQRDNLIHEDSEISIVHENSQQHDEIQYLPKFSLHC